MAEKILVPLPKKRITYKKGPNDSKYVYYVVRSYRNQKGNPTSEEKSIGKIDNKTGMLIPNHNYFDFFPKQKFNSPRLIINVGYLESFRKLSSTIGLKGILKSIFGEKAEIIESLAAYMMARGNVMNDYTNWIASSCTDTNCYFSSQEISRFFASLTEDERLGFFSSWVKLVSDDGYIAYDVTSISTYSENISIAEYCYNRDKESLAQINLEMFVSEKSKLPLFYSIYEGSLVDKVHLPYMMALSQHIKMKKIRFVMDQGFVTHKNIETMVEQKYHVLLLLPENLTLYKDILLEQQKLQHSSKDWFRNLSIYGYKSQRKFGKDPVAIYLYYDPVKASIQEENLYEDIDRQAKVLDLLKSQKKLKPTQTKYFSVKESSRLEFTYTLDHEKIDEVKKRFGYFVLISTDDSLSSEESLDIYRQRNDIEANFDQFKNGMDYRRLRTHHRDTTEGKIFVAFIGLIVRTVFKQRLKADENTRSLSIKKR